MSTLNDEDRENLAAFLDGELDEPASHALEAKLNADPEARKEVDALRKAWSMLDYLPRQEPSPSFTNRTMERLTMALPRGAPTAKVPALAPRRWLPTLVWCAAALLGLTIGAVAGSYVWQAPEPDDPVADVVAQHAPLLARLTLLEPIIDLEFLKSLDQPEMFGDDSEEHERDRPGKPAPLTLGQQRRLATVFLAQPADRREQLVRLDRDLETSPLRDRLVGVAQRYRDWLDHLQPSERERVLNEPDRQKRWALIKDQRDLQWLAFQPKAQREQLETLQGQARADYLRKLRQDEARHQRDWRVAGRLDVAWLKDLPRDVKDYYDEYLYHMLKKDERERILNAQGQWPLFLQTLVELADSHPPARLGKAGPEFYADLPREVKEKLSGKGGKASKALIKDQGEWPFLARAVSQLAHKKKVILPNELWPTDFKCLSPPMQAFMTNKLKPLLNSKEFDELKDASERWPDYPETIQRLSSAHNLQPPWFTLPGPRERWDIYRTPRAETSDPPRP